MTVVDVFAPSVAVLKIYYTIVPRKAASNNREIVEGGI